jgi:sensor domain CHASE-containing protein
MVKVLNRYFANLGGVFLSGLNSGDVFFQLFLLAFIVLIIVLIVSFFRSNKKRNDQLNRIEKKIDDMNQGIKEDVE